MWLKLRVPIRMLFPLQRLTVRLQTVTQRVQQPVHRTLADAMARLLEFPRQPRRTATGPAQRPRRIAARRRIDESFQRRHQVSVVLGQRLAARPRPAQPSRGIVVFRPCGQFLQTRADRRPRQPGRLGHPRDSTASECPCLHRGPTPPGPFVEQRFNRGKLLLNHLCESGCCLNPLHAVLGVLDRREHQTHRPAGRRADRRPEHLLAFVGSHPVHPRRKIRLRSPVFPVSAPPLTLSAGGGGGSFALSGLLLRPRARG